MNVTNSIIDFFQGNPFNNNVGSYIEKATDSKNQAENWTLYMEICDIINAMEDGPKLAVRAIKRLLTTDVVNNTTTILYTLVLLETCVKNCGYRFHLVICTRDFLQELEKLVVGNLENKQTRNDIPIVIRDRVLFLIQTWFDSFKGQPDLKEIEHTYIDLHQLGVHFPITNLSTMSPINTPKKKTPPSKDEINAPPPLTTVDSVPHVLPITDNVVDKLSKNLLHVQSNIDIMVELMRDNPPSAEIPDDTICLMKNLETVCQEMQMRLFELINRWDESDQKESSILFDLLRVNDEMNNTLIQYERYERARIGQVNNDIPEEKLNNKKGQSSLYLDHEEPKVTGDPCDGSNKTQSFKSVKEKIDPDVHHSSEEVEALISKEGNMGGPARSSANLLSSQEFDQFLTERGQNSLSINGDTADLGSTPDTQRPFGMKPRDRGTKEFDI